MIQYLLNATIIWTICLLTYEALLKKETWHQWNRLYLLLSLAAGLVIPLLPFPSGSYPATTAAPVPSGHIDGLLYAKSSALQGTEAAVIAAQPSVSWFWMIYIAGAAVSLGLLLAAGVKLMIVYLRSSKSKHGIYILVETEEAVAPYSFFRLIFLPGCGQYTEAERDMILRHEARHADLKHSLDLLLLHVLQLLLWFHPLIYIFKNRLRLVHEYQADEIARDDYTAYGTFLLEQHLLSAPSYVHSFYHSPIKNRIIMLTKNASAKSKRARYLITVPMLCTFMLVCTNTGFSQEKVRKGNKETFKGNVFEHGRSDKQQTIKADNGEVATLTLFTGPTKINGEKIYRYQEVTKKPELSSGQDMVRIMFDKMKQRLALLPDGEYHMAVYSPVISKNGDVAYYDVQGIETPGTPFGQPEPKNRIKIDKDMQQGFIKDMELMLNHMKFTPAQFKGKAVNAELENDPFFTRKIIVKNHQATLKG